MWVRLAWCYSKLLCHILQMAITGRLQLRIGVPNPTVKKIFTITAIKTGHIMATGLDG